MNQVVKFGHSGRDYRYHVVSKHTLWRVETLFSKEPDTIAWIDAMPEGSHLIDIGANVGMYTVYAGVRGIQVTAFEPEAQNYALLCQNIRENKLNAVAYCLALSDEMKMDKLYMAVEFAGASCHSFGQSVDHNLHARSPQVSQGSMSIALDSLGIKADYIKVDVDGFEHKVVRGAVKTILGAKSVLIEINTSLQEHNSVVKQMLDWGFEFDAEQVKAARRTEGNFSGCGNYIFTR